MHSPLSETKIARETLIRLNMLSPYAQPWTRESLEESMIIITFFLNQRKKNNEKYWYLKNKKSLDKVHLSIFHTSFKTIVELFSNHCKRTTKARNMSEKTTYQKLALLRINVSLTTDQSPEYLKKSPINCCSLIV
jgi:hypothetical protein